MVTRAQRRPRHTEKTAYWLAFCRRYVLDGVKEADAADAQDMPFEQAFANLAYAYLRDKAPGLLGYSVGFQLVDRNEDNSKAIGIFGFKVGKVGGQWLYAPVFFLNGDLKGHELLYIKNQDSFVPLKENWINYLLNKKPIALGAGVNKDTRQLGVRAPDLHRIVQSPSVAKAASAYPDWLADALPALAYALTTDPYKDPRYSGLAELPAVLKEAGDRGVRQLHRLVSAYPALSRPLEAFYGAELPAAIAAVKAAGLAGRAATRSVLAAPAPAARALHVMPAGRSLLDDTPPPAHPIKSGSLQVYTYDPAVNARSLAALSDDDRQELLRDGMKVVDRRRDEETSRAFRGDVPTTTDRGLTNPTETGLYEVLVKPGEFAKCLVICAPHGPNGRKGFATLVAAGDSPGSRGWINIHPSWIWAGKQYGADDYRDWVEAQGKASDGGVPTEEGRQFILAGPAGDGTMPFIVEGTIGDPEGDYQVVKVRFDLYADRPRPAYMLGQSSDRSYAIEMARNSEDFDRWVDGERLHLGGKRGTVLRSAQGDVFVPREFRLIEVEPADYDDDQWEPPEFEKENFKRDVASLTGGLGRSKNPPTVGMSGQPDADLGVYQKTAALRLHCDGAGGSINHGPYRPRTHVLRSLIVDHGLREKVARAMLDECAAGRFQRGGPTRTYRVAYPDWFKAAAAGDYGGAGLVGQGPGAPGFPDPTYSTDDVMGSGRQTLAPQADALPVPGMQADPSNRDAYLPLAGPDPMAAQAANRAAETGQREIFNTAAVGSLLKATHDDQLTDKYLGDLMKGLDRVGRILFLLYWHQDQFQERYGKTEIPELEDSLRNTFADMGDLVLFLRQKSIEPDPRAEIQHIDLKDAGD